MSLSPEEQTILDRIYSKWPIPSGLTNRLPLQTHRYYLAYAEGSPWAVLRLKNNAGFEEWRQRPWRLFATPPTYTDVTTPVLELIEEILTRERGEMRFADVWALIGSEIRFAVTAWGESPPLGAIPLWAYPGSRHDMPIGQFRSNTHEYHAFLDSPLLRIAAAVTA